MIIMKKVNLLAILAISFSLTSFVACTTTEDFVGSDATLAVTAQDEAQSANLSDIAVAVADEYVNSFDAAGFQAVSEVQKVSKVAAVDTGSVVVAATDSGRVVITVDKTGTTVFPKKICVDFGNGVTDKRGTTLKGKIYVTISNRMGVTGSTKKLEYYEFFINDNQLKGSKIVTYLGSNRKVTDNVVTETPSWSISVKDTILRADGTTLIWNSERVRTRISNNATPLIFWDDIYSITGTANGVNAKGTAYTVEITKPLILKGGWKFFVEGTVLTTSEKHTAVLDYGNGEKDAKATLTVNGVTKDINLRK
jgi:hypothetical protein